MLPNEVKQLAKFSKWRWIFLQPKQQWLPSTRPKLSLELKYASSSSRADACALEMTDRSKLFFHFKNAFKMYLLLYRWWISLPDHCRPVSCGRQTTPTITFLLQVGKLLLYKKVKLVGVVCLPTIHRCLKSVHRLPEFYKLLTWIKRILPLKAYSTLHINKSIQQQGEC